MRYPSQIIAVGGAKGGVGKSVLCTNMAVAMALTGQKVVLADCDFGASHLHALIGISNPRYGFRDFFTRDDIEENPSELLLETGLVNLKFLSGAGSFPGSADINQKQENRVLNILRNLKADAVFMDLGPGSAFHNLDQFNMADRKVVVSTPEMPSIMTTFHYLKAALFRRIGQEFKNNSEIQRLLDFSKNPELNEECFEIHQLKEKIQSLEPESHETVQHIIRSFRPDLVINRVRKKRDILMGDNLLKLTKKYLDVDGSYLGYVVESEHVQDSVEEMVPFLVKDPSSKPSENIRQIIGKLTHTDLHLVKKDGSMFVSMEIKLQSGWGQ